MPMQTRFSWLRPVHCASPILALASFLAIATTLAVRTAPARTESSPPAAPTNQANSNISALAKHLQAIGAKMYGAYWCPHCHHQVDLFGQATFDRYIHYIECDPRGEKAKPDLCKMARIQAYPTWEIKGKFYVGVQSLEELATLSEFKGTRKF